MRPPLWPIKCCRSQRTMRPSVRPMTCCGPQENNPSLEPSHLPLVRPSIIVVLGIHLMTINRLITKHGPGRAGWGMFAALALCLAGGCSYSDRPAARSVSGSMGTAHYVDGALAYQNGKRERAISALHLALRDNPNLIMARYLLGTIYKDQSEYEAAAKQFQRVVELDPYSYSNHYNLGLMYHLLNRLQEAMGSYMRALELNPLDSKTNMNIGLVYTALGDPQKGLPYVQKAADLDPKSADAQANLG